MAKKLAPLAGPEGVVVNKLAIRPLLIVVEDVSPAVSIYFESDVQHLKALQKGTEARIGLAGRSPR